MSALTDIGSAAGTVIAALVAVVAAMDARRSAARQHQESRRQHEETQHQASIALEGVLAERDLALQRWADEVIDRMSEAHALCDIDPQRRPERPFLERCSELSWRLSALVDRGRLFLPNTEAAEVGGHKSVAYRGLRQRALDHVVSACRLVERLRSRRDDYPTGEIAKGIIAGKRGFVSEVQAMLDPRARQQRLRKLAGREEPDASKSASGTGDGSP